MFSKSNTIKKYKKLARRLNFEEPATGDWKENGADNDFIASSLPTQARKRKRKRVISKKNIRRNGARKKKKVGEDDLDGVVPLSQDSWEDEEVLLENRVRREDGARIGEVVNSVKNSVINARIACPVSSRQNLEENQGSKDPKDTSWKDGEEFQANRVRMEDGGRIGEVMDSVKDVRQDLARESGGYKEAGPVISRKNLEEKQGKVPEDTSWKDEEVVLEDTVRFDDEAESGEVVNSVKDVRQDLARGLGGYKEAGPVIYDKNLEENQGSKDPEDTSWKDEELLLEDRVRMEGAARSGVMTVRRQKFGIDDRPGVESGIEKFTAASHVSSFENLEENEKGKEPKEVLQENVIRIEDTPRNRKLMDLSKETDSSKKTSVDKTPGGESGTPRFVEAYKNSEIRQSVFGKRSEDSGKEDLTSSCKEGRMNDVPAKRKLNGLKMTKVTPKDPEVSEKSFPKDVELLKTDLLNNLTDYLRNAIQKIIDEKAESLKISGAEQSVEAYGSSFRGSGIGNSMGNGQDCLSKSGSASGSTDFLRIAVEKILKEKSMSLKISGAEQNVEENGRSFSGSELEKLNRNGLSGKSAAESVSSSGKKLKKHGSESTVSRIETPKLNCRSQENRKLKRKFIADNNSAKLSPQCRKVCSVPPDVKDLSSSPCFILATPPGKPKRRKSLKTLEVSPSLLGKVKKKKVKQNETTPEKGRKKDSSVPGQPVERASSIIGINNADLLLFCPSSPEIVSKRRRPKICQPKDQENSDTTLKTCKEVKTTMENQKSDLSLFWPSSPEIVTRKRTHSPKSSPCYIYDTQDSRLRRKHKKSERENHLKPNEASEAVSNTLSMITRTERLNNISEKELEKVREQVYLPCLKELSPLPSLLEIGKIRSEENKLQKIDFKPNFLNEPASPEIPTRRRTHSPKSSPCYIFDNQQSRLRRKHKKSELKTHLNPYVTSEAANNSLSMITGAERRSSISDKELVKAREQVDLPCLKELSPLPSTLEIGKIQNKEKKLQHNFLEEPSEAANCSLSMIEGTERLNSVLDKQLEKFVLPCLKEQSPLAPSLEISKPQRKEQPNSRLLTVPTAKCPETKRVNNTCNESIWEQSPSIIPGTQIIRRHSLPKVPRSKERMRRSLASKLHVEKQFIYPKSPVITKRRTRLISKEIQEGLDTLQKNNEAVEVLSPILVTQKMPRNVADESTVIRKLFAASEEHEKRSVRKELVQDSEDFILASHGAREIAKDRLLLPNSKEQISQVLSERSAIRRNVDQWLVNVACAGSVDSEKTFWKNPESSGFKNRVPVNLATEDFDKELLGRPEPEMLPHCDLEIEPDSEEILPCDKRGPFSEGLSDKSHRALQKKEQKEKEPLNLEVEPPNSCMLPEICRRPAKMKPFTGHCSPEIHVSTAQDVLSDTGKHTREVKEKEPSNLEVEPQNSCMMSPEICRRSVKMKPFTGHCSPEMYVSTAKKVVSDEGKLLPHRTPEKTSNLEIEQPTSCMTSPEFVRRSVKINQQVSGQCSPEICVPTAQDIDCIKSLRRQLKLALESSSTSQLDSCPMSPEFVLKRKNKVKKTIMEPQETGILGNLGISGDKGLFPTPISKKEGFFPTPVSKKKGVQWADAETKIPCLKEKEPSPKAIIFEKDVGRAAGVGKRKISSPEIFMKRVLCPLPADRKNADTQAIDQFNTETLHLVASGTKAEGWSSEGKISDILSDEKFVVNVPQTEFPDTECADNLDAGYKKKKSIPKRGLLAEFHAVQSSLSSERRVMDYERQKSKGQLPGAKMFFVLDVWGRKPLWLQVRSQDGEAVIVLSKEVVKNPRSIVPGCSLKIFPPWDLLEGDSGNCPVYQSIRTFEVSYEKHQDLETSSTSSIVRLVPSSPYFKDSNKFICAFLKEPPDLNRGN